MKRTVAAMCLGGLLLLGATSCGFSDPCDGSGMMFSRDPGDANLWVGDSHRYRVSLFLSDPGCEKEIANSFDSPADFAFSTTDAAVATVSANGSVTAVAPGNAMIMIDYRGVAGSIPVLVTRPIADVRITFTPATVALNNTVTARVEALDAAGAVIPNARVWGYQVTNRSGATIRHLTYEVGVPGEIRFVAAFSGQYDVTAEYRRTPTTRISKTATFTVP